MLLEFKRYRKSSLVFLKIIRELKKFNHFWLLSDFKIFVTLQYSFTYRDVESCSPHSSMLSTFTHVFQLEA